MLGNFLEILDQFFARHEFTKNKLIWYQKKNDGFIVFQFQKFKYDPEGSGFINFGLVFNTHQKSVKKPGGEDTWDLRGRVPRFGTTPLADGLFKIAISDTEKQKVDLVLIGIEKEIIPFLEHYSQLSNLIDDLKNKKFDFSKALTRIVP